MSPCVSFGHQDHVFCFGDSWGDSLWYSLVGGLDSLHLDLNPQFLWKVKWKPQLQTTNPKHQFQVKAELRPSIPAEVKLGKCDPQ